MMTESLVELVKRVAAEYDAAKSRDCEISEKSEKSRPGAPLSSHISLISQSEGSQKSGGALLDAADLRDRYTERAAICQFDGGQDRARAEARAWNQVAVRWYHRHGTRTSGGLCAGCGKTLGIEGGILLLPHGERAHADGRYACIRRYGRRWKRQAAIALAAIGIPTPSEIAVEIKEGSP